MAKHTELKDRIRQQMGLDKVDYRLSIKNWVNWLLDNEDLKIKSIARGLAFGIKTGRITNINANQELVNPKTFKPYSNLQVLTIICKAVVNLEETTSAKSVDALQIAMNKTVVNL